jgi:hypothetical protein
LKDHEVLPKKKIILYSEQAANLGVNILNKKLHRNVVHPLQHQIVVSTIITYNEIIRLLEVPMSMVNI